MGAPIVAVIDAVVGNRIPDVNVPAERKFDITTSLHHSINMRTTITVDDDVFEAARALMRSSGQTLGQVLSRLARRGLRVQGTPAVKNGLPVFDVSGNAPIIPSDRASAILADELP